MVQWWCWPGSVGNPPRGSHAGQLLRLCVPCPDSTREEEILHGYCSGVWLKEPDGASWNEERFWWYINKVVYDLK
jgi:hypothetical protein